MRSSFLLPHIMFIKGSYLLQKYASCEEFTCRDSFLPLSNKVMVFLNDKLHVIDCGCLNDQLPVIDCGCLNDQLPVIDCGCLNDQFPVIDCGCMRCFYNTCE
ncbi:hypothetical protein POVCU2_0027250 [Plasmodium ovale curtisi]|uniref:Uncharacterized protein n=1 Tax=Plasmodium ovale curtisi TaxID=864141 RepID=A0A1A8VZ54_PLAOA|nr:hypothetical protein POVCU2_0027250 [Plasmodium ovale curtisi]SBS93240.1 hypothetical protein POVCU1_024990 [Plasmodium ovale curtisi]